MYFIMWTKQIQFPNLWAVFSKHTVHMPGDDQRFDPGNEKNLCKTYLLRILGFKDSEFWAPYKFLNNNLEPPSLKQLSYYNKQTYSMTPFKNVTPSCQFLNWIEFRLNSDSIPPSALNYT